jgi:hypothetical protein
MNLIHVARSPANPCLRAPPGDLSLSPIPTCQATPFPQSASPCPTALTHAPTIGHHHHMVVHAHWPLPPVNRVSHISPLRTKSPACWIGLQGSHPSSPYPRCHAAPRACSGSLGGVALSHVPMVFRPDRAILSTLKSLTHLYRGRA